MVDVTNKLVKKDAIPFHKRSEAGTRRKEGRPAIVPKTFGAIWKYTFSSEKNPSNSVVLVRHISVYATVMRFMDYSNVEDRMKNLVADFVRTKRGGMITHHGLVAYPVLVLCTGQLKKLGLAGH